MMRVTPSREQYSQSPTRSDGQSGVLAYLSFIYRLPREGKRISDEETGRMKIPACQYFTGKTVFPGFAPPGAGTGGCTGYDPRQGIYRGFSQECRPGAGSRLAGMIIAFSKKMLS